MNQATLQQIKRHLTGLLKAIESQDEKEIQIDEKMIYYDSNGNVIDIKIKKTFDISS